MVIVSHRGNLSGPASDQNTPEALSRAASICYCELDLWVKKDKLYLGHNEPSLKITSKFLQNKNFIIHAKNLEAVNYLSKTNLHWFWHNNDKLTITSKGMLWCFPDIYVDNGITVVHGNDFKLDSYGLCTDYPLELISRLAKL
tara:strand:+ start:51 stop:479 length:429 start_codon:yes stop_codon:yes gene_type:complete